MEKSYGLNLNITALWNGGIDKNISPKEPNSYLLVTDVAKMPNMVTYWSFGVFLIVLYATYNLSYCTIF